MMRRGLTLVELLLFVGILALASGAIIGLMVLTNENRARQGATVDVEQNGLQLLQFLTNEIRHAERILGPARGSSGSILVLQVADDNSNPVIIAAQSGALLLVRRDAEANLTPVQVMVTEMRVWNTSVTDDRPSLSLSFTVRGIAAPTQSGAYTRTFQTGMTLFPDALTQGAACGCGAPQCVGHHYRWFVCNAGSCAATTGSLLCP